MHVSAYMCVSDLMYALFTRLPTNTYTDQLRALSLTDGPVAHPETDLGSILSFSMSSFDFF